MAAAILEDWHETKARLCEKAAIYLKRHWLETVCTLPALAAWYALPVRVDVPLTVLTMGLVSLANEFCPSTGSGWSRKFGKTTPGQVFSAALPIAATSAILFLCSSYQHADLSPLEKGSITDWVKGKVIAGNYNPDQSDVVYIGDKSYRLTTMNVVDHLNSIQTTYKKDEPSLTNHLEGTRTILVDVGHEATSFLSNKKQVSVNEAVLVEVSFSQLPKSNLKPPLKFNLGN